MATVDQAYARSDSVLASAQTFIDQLQVLAQDDTITLGFSNWVLTPWDYNIYDGVAIPAVGTVDGSKLTTLDDLAVDPTVAVPIPTSPTDNYYTSALPVIWAIGELEPFTEIVPATLAPPVPVPGVFTPPTPHNVADVAIPVWEDKVLPTNVVLLEVPIDAPSVLEIDVVDLVVPVMDLVIPTNPFVYNEETYSSDLLTSIEALLSADVENGGYGIEPTDEQAIYDRADERESKLAALAVNQARKGIAARGFLVPPGSLYATENVILAQNIVSLAQLNREIVLKRSDLYVQARQFAVQQGLDLEQALITYTSAKQERALKAAQITAELVIQFHNAAVGLFELKTALTELELAIHREQLATAATKLQEYGQKLAYVDMTEKRNQVRLEQYNQQLETCKVFYEAQKAQAVYAQLSMELENLKLEASKEVANIYAVEVKAKADEYDMYRTAWGAEETKLKVFTQKLAAHDQKLETIVKESRLRQDQFEAEIDLVKIQRERQAMLLEQYGVVIRKATLDADVGTTMNREQLEQQKNFLQTSQFNTNLEFQRTIEHASKLLEAQKTNIAMMDVAVSNVLKLKDLNGASAKAALQLYEQAVSGSEGTLTVIETIAGT